MKSKSSDPTQAPRQSVRPASATGRANAQAPALAWLVEGTQSRRIHPVVTGGEAGSRLGELLASTDEPTAAWRELLHPEDAERAEAAFGDALARGSLEVDYRVVLPDGTVVHVSERGRVVDGDRAPRVLGAAFESPRAAARGKPADSDAAARARNEGARRASGEILSPLAHDLRSGLTGILGWTQVLERVTDEAARTRGMEGIRRAVAQQIRLAEDVSEAGRALRGSDDEVPETIELDATIQAAAAEAAAIAKARGVEIEFEPGGQATTLIGHGRIVRQLVRMLIADAIQQAPAAGSLTISLSVRENHVVVELVAAAPRSTGADAADLREPGRNSVQPVGETSGNVRRSVAALLARLHGGQLEVLVGYETVLRATLPLRLSA